MQPKKLDDITLLRGEYVDGDGKVGRFVGCRAGLLTVAWTAEAYAPTCYAFDLPARPTKKKRER